MIYIKKLLNQDQKKEIAFPKEPSRFFFDFNYDVAGEPRRDLTFTYEPIAGNNNIESLLVSPIEVTMREHNEKGESKITSGLKSFIFNELGANVGDLLIITNTEDDNTKYTFDLVKKINTELYDKYNFLMETNHTISILENSPEDEENIVKMITEVKGKDIAPKANDNKEPKQVIFYGVPGAGKSYTINNELDKNGILKDNTIRVVFHPEYTNADFVGQILPKLTNTGINYVFTPGPFTQIVRKAYQHPENNYALIIEEINRGNAAAIFGELFQLLDRLDKDTTDKSNNVIYTKNWSVYGVNNDYINYYLLGNYDTDTTEDRTQVSINFNQNTAIRLPANLSLFATMNTSDQNVFRLDNAFKRRWDMQLIPNKFGVSEEEQAQANSIVDGYDFTWGAFREAVNQFITDPENDNENTTFSDKQLGTWFIKNIDGHIDCSGFTNKVLEYLWDDVFTDDFTIFNKEKCNTFEKLEELSKASNRNDIFLPEFLNRVDAAQIDIDSTIIDVEETVLESSNLEETGFTKFVTKLAHECDSSLLLAARNSGYYGFNKGDTSFNFTVIMNRKKYYTLDIYLDQESVVDKNIEENLNKWYVGHNIDKNHCDRESYRFQFPKDATGNAVDMTTIESKFDAFKSIFDKAYRQRNK